mmetsp:Transcript_1580/g.2928  ORF Transcript_1580/g.2928 Transcript_1580/m.2928 type:complete len:195 (+) Transcript_1580:847-1431(+)
MQPSATVLRVVSTPIVVAEPCSGISCPFDSWCRSKYGSCGPGYAYCNSHSIWKESCNEPADVTSSSSAITPEPTTSEPTKKPTRIRDSSSNFNAAVNIRDFPETSSSSQDTTTGNINFGKEEEVVVTVHSAGAREEEPPSAQMAIGMAVGLTAATLVGMGWAMVIKGYYVRNLGSPLLVAQEVGNGGLTTPELL